MLRIIRTCFGPNSPPPHQMIPSVKGVPLYSLDAPTSEQTIVDPQPRQQPLSEDVSATILLTSSSVEVPVEEVVLEYLHKNILVLGFYDRDNTGDELFKDAFRFLLGDTASLTFACTDDVTVVPEGTDVVIVGGGDVINDYFMAKVTSILDASPVFKGEVYAL